jgi:hypothetical protein
MKLEHINQDTCDEIFCHTIYRNSFLRNYRLETRNRRLNDLTRTQTQTDLRADLTSQLHVHYIRGRLTNPREIEPCASNLPSVQHCRLANTSLLNNVTRFSWPSEEVNCVLRRRHYILNLQNLIFYENLSVSAYHLEDRPFNKNGLQNSSG